MALFVGWRDLLDFKGQHRLVLSVTLPSGLSLSRSRALRHTPARSACDRLPRRRVRCCLVPSLDLDSDRPLE